ncbi:hypothetical protein AAG747_14995 [Rapidithrix thailandica]|uniref:Uncharacterized protein n=1 Tax=Rapidithrix thailandica TaxID=413964 RepID=A0AAW9SA73_9BACT
MDPVTKLFIVGVGVVVLIVLIKFAKALIKGVAFIVLLGLAYLLFMKDGSLKVVEEKGMKMLFNEYSWTELEAMCTEEQETVKCDCIVTPVKEDLRARFSRRKLKKLSEDPELVKAEIKISLQNRKKDIQQCLIAKNSETLLRTMETVWGALEQVREQ